MSTQEIAAWTLFVSAILKGIHLIVLEFTRKGSRPESEDDDADVHHHDQ